MRDILKKEQAKLTAKLAAANALKGMGRVMVELAAMKQAPLESIHSHFLAEKEPEE